MRFVFFVQISKNFFFIRYEDLCSKPESVVKGIYSFLEIDQFEHNFEDIPQITVEDDTVHGIYGDHTIRNTLGMLPDDSKQILGEFNMGEVITDKTGNILGSENATSYKNDVDFEDSLDSF